MHILHILNSYGGTEVYTQFIQTLDKLGVKQTVFVPLNPKNRQRKGNHLIEFGVNGSKIIYSTKLKHYHRYLYQLKINTIKKEVVEHVDLKTVDLVHAGLFSTDGAIAYELAKITKIPFIVAVRNTDINYYYKKMWWRRKYFHNILSESKNIIFISHQYKRSFLKLIKDQKVDNLHTKSVVLPNGVHDFYLKNRVEYVQKIKSPIKIVYAGAFNRDKKILETLKGLEILVNKGYLIEFTIVGKGLRFRTKDKKYEDLTINYAKDRKWVAIMNSLPKEKLIIALRESNIFVMPSSPETFGIVYLEALSQGLPILCAKGQGFDGFYNDRNIGFAVDPNDQNDIADKIEQIIINYDQMAYNVGELKLDNDFSWLKISQKYLQLYKNATKK